LASSEPPRIGKGQTVYQAHFKKSGGEEVEIKEPLRMGKLIGVGKENDEENKD
jgi:hypothetical protein